jgi:hypothetical protein
VPASQSQRQPRPTTGLSNQNYADACHDGDEVSASTLLLKARRLVTSTWESNLCSLNQCAVNELQISLNFNDYCRRDSLVELNAL